MHWIVKGRWWCKCEFVYIENLIIHIMISVLAELTGHSDVSNRSAGYSVRDRWVQLVDGTSGEEGTGRRQLIEVEEGIDAEELPVNIRIWQIVTRDVLRDACQSSFKDVVVVRIFTDIRRQLLRLTAEREQRLAPVVCRQIAVHDFGMIPDSDRVTTDRRRSRLHTWDTRDQLRQISQPLLFLHIQERVVLIHWCGCVTNRGQDISKERSAAWNSLVRA